MEKHATSAAVTGSLQTFLVADRADVGVVDRADRNRVGRTRQLRRSRSASRCCLRPPRSPRRRCGHWRTRPPSGRPDTARGGAAAAEAEVDRGDVGPWRGSAAPSCTRPGSSWSTPVNAVEDVEADHPRARRDAPTTMPATLVPWPLASRLPSSIAKSRATATLQPAGTPGAVQPNKYVGSKAGVTTTLQLDNVKILKN